MLYATKKLKALKANASPDEQIGIKMVENAARQPIATIVDNAGRDGSAIIEHLLELNDESIGYDALSHQFVDMVK